MKKRIVSIVLALVMVLSLLPMSVLADDTAPYDEATLYLTYESNSNKTYYFGLSVSNGTPTLKAQQFDSEPTGTEYIFHLEAVSGSTDSYYLYVENSSGTRYYIVIGGTAQGGLNRTTSLSTSNSSAAQFKIGYEVETTSGFNTTYTLHKTEPSSWDKRVLYTTIGSTDWILENDTAGVRVCKHMQCGDHFDIDAEGKISTVTYTVTYKAAAHTSLTADVVTSNLKTGDSIPTAPAVTADAGYTLGSWTCTEGTPGTGNTVGTTNLVYEITATENANVTINYVAGTGGKVSPTSESVAPATGTAAGSTATPDAGYHFVNWTCNGTQVSINAKYVPGKNASGVYETATYTANFAPNTNTAYTVKHYKQNLDGTYPYTPTETDNLTGTTGELTKATAKTYTGFTAQSFSQQTIAGDGKTVVEIFYARNTYTVTYDLNGGSTTSPKTSFTGVKYGADTPTINNPTKEGYTFVGWDKEIARTVTASITYTAQWEVDNWKDNPDGPDSETGGDGIPDKYQALIKYQSADSSKGTVSPTVQVETLTKDNTGKYTGNVTVASTATATADKVAFDYWLAPNGTTKSYAAALSGSLSVSGGQTYTYTAYFDTDNNEDGTPDKYQVFVNFVPADSNGTVTGDGIKQVYTFENHATSGDVTPTLTGVTVKANDGYAFDVWTKDSGAEAVNPETKLTNVAGGTTITFKANFAKDEIGPDDGGDGIPDKYQVLINYVSASESQGAVDPAKEVVTLYAKDSASGKWVRIDDAAAAGSTAAAKSGYKFVKWTNEDGTTVSTEAKYVPSVKEAQGGETYTFTAHFASAHVPSTPKLEKGTHFNYVMGYSDGTIRPNNEITRAEIAIIFFRLLTDESRDAYYSEHNDFTDVAETSKSNIAISTLTNAGILTGYNDGTFRPNAKVTRGQLAAIIARFADMKGSVDKTFTDIDGHWAKDLILLAASNGWIDGYSDGTFRPAQNITRAQTMAIINRALDRQVSDVNDLVDDMNVWVDNMDPTAWYYFHVQEATNYHEYNRKAGTLDEIWTKKLPDIDWSVYQY